MGISGCDYKKRWERCAIRRASFIYHVTIM